MDDKTLMNITVKCPVRDAKLKKDYKGVMEPSMEISGLQYFIQT